MNRTDADFIRAKIASFAATLDHPLVRANFSAMFELHVAELDKTNGWTRAEALKLDNSIEMMALSLLCGSEEPGRAALRSPFGFDRLGDDPNEIVRRVLKRGTIESDAEAEIIMVIVTNQGNEATYGRDTFHRLAEILDEAGY